MPDDVNAAGRGGPAAVAPTGAAGAASGRRPCRAGLILRLPCLAVWTEVPPLPDSPPRAALRRRPLAFPSTRAWIEPQLLGSACGHLERPNGTTRPSGPRFRCATTRLVPGSLSHHAASDHRETASVRGRLSSVVCAGPVPSSWLESFVRACRLRRWWVSIWRLRLDGRGGAPPLRTRNAVPAAAITTSAMAISVHISSRDAGVHKLRRDGLAALAVLPLAPPFPRQKQR